MSAPMFAPVDDETDDLLALVAGAESERDRAFALLDVSDYKSETKDILRVIVTVAHELDTFSANDCRSRMPALASTARIGRAFALAQELGLIRFVALVKSTDRGTHGKRINVYRRAA